MPLQSVALSARQEWSLANIAVPCSSFAEHFLGTSVFFSELEPLAELEFKVAATDSTLSLKSCCYDRVPCRQIDLPHLCIDDQQVLLALSPS